jgi:eukaryotic-like serine/threonine-protein kinase
MYDASETLIASENGSTGSHRSVPSWHLEGAQVGQYRLGQRIAAGGVAEVYRGRHLRLMREAAVKVPLPSHSAAKNMAERFRREAEIIRRLDHPAFVEFLDRGRDGNISYIGMEFLEGETVQARIERCGPLQPEHAAEIARQAAEGMAFAHRRRKIVHRDLSPLNILLTSDPERPGADRVKILDLGLAREMGEGESRVGVFEGTPHYAAPEQIGGSMGPPGDVYALGCVMFFMLSGHPPYDGDDVDEVLAAHLFKELPPIRSPFGPLPAELEEIVRGAMAKRPQRRAYSMTSLAAALADWLSLAPPMVPMTRAA